ncbi:MAG: DUF2089 domain-containing protein [Tissierellia bacterium]|nr:DUF2089 domain-containing protein [Tissierellia bacterium]
MTNKSLYQCPVCDHELTIKAYQCKACGTKIEGDFQIDKFSRLTKEEKDFIELFIMKRGSIKEIEKELNISYPTVRNKLDNVISALGHKVERDSSSFEILQMLDRGEISSDEAQKLLNKMKE